MNNTHIAVFNRNKFEYGQLILYGFFRNLKLLVMGGDIYSSVITHCRNIFFAKKYIKESVEKSNVMIGKQKGLWYEINESAIDLSTKFYNHNIKKHDGFIKYYNSILGTQKFEAYIKKELCRQIFNLLKQFHAIRLSALPGGKILMCKNPVSKFVVEYMEDKHQVKYRIKWIGTLWPGLFVLIYYAWLFRELMKRGVVFNRQKKKYRLAREAASETSHSSILGDDIAIDGKRFKKEDMLMLKFSKNPQRENAFKEAVKKGFNTASVPELKININRDFFNILFFYLFVPLRTHISLFASGQAYLSYYIALFHKRCFPIEVLMNLYGIKCFISNKLWGDAEETIILNRYGTKNVILHLSDLTHYRDYMYAFSPHNIYFTWGDIHYDSHADNYFVDEKFNIGCPYKRNYNKAICNKEKIIKEMPLLQTEKKKVTFFDTAFDNDTFVMEEYFLQYLEMVKEFCDRRKDLSILLKPKALPGEELKISQNNRKMYERLRKELDACKNFVLVNSSKWAAEEVISISDVCVTMGMNSPATIALICGKNALYFDPMSDKNHLFAKKYHNILVFEDKNLLFKQIENILTEKVNCQEVLSEKDIRLYDAFDDDMALERLRDNLYQLPS
ncbi:MAG: hypothetical protein HQ579_06955 [Candidatus Omnitrophica bacterium]|nr:hypothetical protein [Candidatus Omnitrophota bacterium]